MSNLPDVPDAYRKGTKRPVQTVQGLLTQLQGLPRGMKLEAPVRVIVTKTYDGDRVEIEDVDE